MKRLGLFFLGLSVTLGYADSAAHPDSHYTLDNGLQLHVIEDHRAPLAWFQIWYKVGSSDETTGLTGIAHALEHMMFKGTDKYQDGAIWRLVKENGGVQNAFTSRDYTCYWQRFPSDRIALSFDIESDRMQHLRVQPTDFEKEQQVITEERRMRVEDNPFALANEQFSAALMAATPYQHPIIGWQRDIMNITASDMQQWYDTWYTPSNATIVVAGDVQPDQILALANKYFGTIPSRTVPKLRDLSPVPQLGEKNLVVHAAATVPSIATGVVVPTLVTAGSADKKTVYALSLLDQVLSGGRSAVLTKWLVRDKQIAASAGSYYNPFAKYDTEFVWYAIPTPKTDIHTVKVALASAIDTMKQQPIAPALLAQAKAQFVANARFEKESPGERAELTGMLASVGLSMTDYEAFLQGVQQVSAHDLQQIARRFFITNQQVTAILQPLAQAK